uniref:Secreted protein n=1 Tax=Romanomermis culicivorax TaxID=13658 RepID=A0A915HTX1_ROMCU
MVSANVLHTTCKLMLGALRCTFFIIVVLLFLEKRLLFVRAGHPILRNGRLVDIRGDSERRVVEFAARIYFCIIVSRRELALRA